MLKKQKRKRGGGGEIGSTILSEKPNTWHSPIQSLTCMQFLDIPDHLDTGIFARNSGVLQQQQRRELRLTAQTEHRLSDYDIHIWTTAIGQLAVGLETEKFEAISDEIEFQFSADRSTTAGHSRTTK